MENKDKKRKKHRIITHRCDNPMCRNEINISECLENDDYDKIDTNTISVYCPKCGAICEVKL